MLPRIETIKTVMFTRRIIAFNESFVPLGSQKNITDNATAVIWHEAIAGRNKEDIISAFHAFFISKRDKKKIVLWLDNCAAQNKNWTLITFIVYMVNSDEITAEEIELNYLETGHTFMSADSFHHQVELSMKRSKHIYDFSDFKHAVQQANSKNVEVVNLQPSDFSDWQNLCSVAKINKQNPRPYLNKMVQITSRRGKLTVSYKEDFSDAESVEVNILNVNTVKNGFPVFKKRVNGRGISQVKKTDIVQKLIPMMPKNRQQFWLDMQVSDVPDLVHCE